MVNLFGAKLVKNIGMHYFLAHVLAKMIATTHIDRTIHPLSPGPNIPRNAVWQANNIKTTPTMTRRRLMLHCSFSSLLAVLYPAINQSPLPARIRMARTKQPRI